MKKKANILLVANWESNAGYAWWLMENFWTIIATHMKPKGIKSILIYPKITKIPEAITNTDINILEHNFHDTSIAGLIKLRKLIKSNQVRYIYLTDSPSYNWLYILLRLWGIKTIIIHDHTPGERITPKGIKRFLKSTVQRIPYFTADHFIAVTEFVHKRLLNISCIPADKCSCAPNGIKPINLQSSDMNYAQKLFDIPKDKTIIITTGRATCYKGIDFFIECANELINNQGRTEFQFLYCGDGPDIQKFKKMVSTYKLTDNFIFAGRRNDVRDILPSCDIGFHCATGEVGYSLSILEYMSAGIVCIVPSNPSTSLAIDHNINGFIYKNKDAQSAVEMLLKSSSKKDTLTLTQKAINDVKTKYCLDNTNKTFCRILDQVIT